MRYGQKCLLCGRESPTGLQVMGCLICFHCEKKLLRDVENLPARDIRLRLGRLYGKSSRTEAFPF